MNDKEQALKELHEISGEFNKAMGDIKQDRETYWNSLSKEEQLKCFCAVVERIVDGETEGRSYRGMLYSVFGFGPESYAQAQMSGFLNLHNSFVTPSQEEDTLLLFAKHAGIKNPEEVVTKYITEKM